MHECTNNFPVLEILGNPGAEGTKRESRNVSNPALRLTDGWVGYRRLKLQLAPQKE
jgi:hypothetical protein